MWAREWLGKKIIDLNTGASLGRVIRLVTDEGLMAVRYLVLRPADMRQRLLALPFRHAYPGQSGFSRLGGLPAAGTGYALLAVLDASAPAGAPRAFGSGTSGRPLPGCGA